MPAHAGTTAQASVLAPSRPLQKWERAPGRTAFNDSRIAAAASITTGNSHSPICFAFCAKPHRLLSMTRRLYMYIQAGIAAASVAGSLV